MYAQLVSLLATTKKKKTQQKYIQYKQALKPSNYKSLPHQLLLRGKSFSRLISLGVANKFFCMQIMLVYFLMYLVC